MTTRGITEPTGAFFHSVNPANGDRLWQGQEATEQDITTAYDNARIAFSTWRHVSLADRARFLLDFAKRVDEKKQTLIQWIALETGKPLWEALAEANSVVQKIALSIQAHQERLRDIHDASNILRYKPHGVVAVLGPFNFPAHLSNGHIIPALLAGNTVLYKPSELTPGVAAFIMQCFHESGLPPGVIQCLQGGVTVAKALLQHPIQGVFFTGSYATGQRIHQQFAGRPDVLLALEMGGNNPLVIDKVADITAAVYHSLLSAFITAGQRCTCARRLIIPNTAFGDAFLTQFIQASKAIQVGPFTQQPEPFMGPVIRHAHALSHLEKQKALIASGGKALLSMSLLETNTGFLSPGVMDMSHVSHPLDDEIFAPLVQVYRYHHFEEALELANDTHYGLAAGLLSDSQAHYQQFYQEINAGLINWNRPTTGASSSLPFGGIGQSGNHRPSAYFATDYCAYPIASQEQAVLGVPVQQVPGLLL